jgi:hypothetical protein
MFNSAYLSKRDKDSLKKLEKPIQMDKLSTSLKKNWMLKQDCTLPLK